MSKKREDKLYVNVGFHEHLPDSYLSGRVTTDTDGKVKGWLSVGNGLSVAHGDPGWWRRVATEAGKVAELLALRIAHPTTVEYVDDSPYEAEEPVPGSPYAPWAEYVMAEEDEHGLRDRQGRGEAPAGGQAPGGDGGGDGK